MPTLEILLQHVKLETDLLAAAVDRLDQIGTARAVDSIAKIFCFRERTLNDGLGYRGSAHDFLCRRATAALIGIGTPRTLVVFVRKIDAAGNVELTFRGRTTYGAPAEFHFPQDVLRNLISAILLEDLTAETRSLSLYSLAWNRRLMQVLVEVLRPG